MVDDTSAFDERSFVLLSIPNKIGPRYDDNTKFRNLCSISF